MNRMWPKAHTLGVLAVLAAAAGLRFYDFNADGFHIDDFQPVAKALLPLPDLLDRLAQDSYLEPPLSYLLLKLTLLFSESEWITRLPSVLASMAGVGLIYILGRRLFNPTVGIIAAAILAVAPSDIRYAQGVRFWSEFSAVHLASLVLLVWALQRNEFRPWAAYSVTVLLGIYLNVLMLAVVALQAALLLLLFTAGRRDNFHLEALPVSWDRLRRFFVANGVALVALLPWVAFIAVHWLTRERFVLSRGYDLTPDPAFLHTTAKWLFMNTPSDGPLVWFFYTSIILGLTFSLTKRQVMPFLLVGYALAFLPLMAILSELLKTFLPTRRIAFLLPLFALAAAVGVQYLGWWASSLARNWQFTSEGLQKRVARFLMGATLLAATLLAVGLSMPHVLNFYASERTNYEGAGAFLRENVKPSDLIVLSPKFEEFHDVIRYYMGGDLTASSLTLEDFAQLSQEQSGATEYVRIWWVTNFPPSSSRYKVIAFNTPGRDQPVAGARGLSQFKVSVFVAYEDLPSPLSTRAAKLAALALAREQAQTPYPILPGERRMGAWHESKLSEQLIEEFDLRDGFLLQSGRSVVMLYQGQRWFIPSTKMLEQCGYDGENIYRVPRDLLESIPIGERIFISGPPCPKQSTAAEALHLMDGLLVKGSGPSVYVMEDGRRRPFVSPTALQRCGYDWTNIYGVDDQMLARVPRGDEVPQTACPQQRTVVEVAGLRDGALIKGEGNTIFVVEAGFKRPLTNPDALTSCGYDPSDLRVLADPVLAMIPDGDPVNGSVCPEGLGTDVVFEEGSQEVGDAEANPPQPLVHTVQPGENLSSIAVAYQVSIEKLIAANGIEDPALLLVGQELIIPQ